MVITLYVYYLIWLCLELTSHNKLIVMEYIVPDYAWALVESQDFTELQTYWYKVLPYSGLS